MSKLVIVTGSDKLDYCPEHGEEKAVEKAGQEIIIAGNWKMHKTRAQAIELSEGVVQALKSEADLPTVVLCPPFTSLEVVVSKCASTAVAVGAQNMDWRDFGAYTGEVSGPMLTDIGATYVIIGHSERRQFFGETNQSVNEKLKSALKHKLVPILCVGESIDERESHLTDSVIARQVASALKDLEPESLESLVIAYEPVWAIGTGRVCEASEANRVIKLIRLTINNLYNKKEFAQSVPCLYGGSVKPNNIDELLAESDIDGALVGGASLTMQEFLPLIKAAQRKIRLAFSKA